ncbi:acyl-CoA dehydrogenase family protein [Streptomyces antimycoticus]|uniref:acyl-CoA dehydrogenase family protein n=1 Tax=Streptomyces TaxID=1883 RepID=UPI000A3B306E|nr:MULTISPECIES: acyl-CoA dehydrogenase family protein [Streptomyces]QTI87993.1 acyl-CoA/acyl-ACP dehydrogenase [Streptomyces sp. AgN23]RSS38118.1 acyl-CoA dehydrogenase [Streptomyces sp. WAC05858]WJE00925.1 acyl-CoA dehydrogenase family protein [Streptomyces antimycoticus]WTA80265.1 acyl-CoA/acyl-ACP dehydrogenase [Streptomyces antimycoticus]
MDRLLTPDEREHRGRMLKLVLDRWEDQAHTWESGELLPEEVVVWCAEQKLTGAPLPASVGGGGWSAMESGLLYEALGRVSISLASLVNVHGMMAQTLTRWGTAWQHEHIMPALGSGERIAAICMTEPHAGSDLSGITTTLSERDGRLLLNGTKVYITFGQRADDLLVFVQRDGKSEACLVRRDAPGVTIEPMGDMLGLRAAGLARIVFEDCVIAPEAVVGKPGFAVPVLVPTALEHGRHAVAWMALGMLEACFEECARFVRTRKTFGSTLIEHGQIQTLVTRMGADLEAARHLCVAASRAMQDKAPETMRAVLLAKYFVCRVAEEHTASAVQLLASSGVSERSVTARAYRDSKVLNIIEGTEQILERTLAPMLVNGAGGSR